MNFLNIDELKGLEFLFSQITIGKLSFSLFSLSLGVVLVFILILVTSFLRIFLLRRLFPKFHIEEGIASAYSKLVGYVFFLFGLYFILPVTFNGFSFATLGVIFGGLSFGIGFGIRNIADNFVSGLIILLERPIKVGDRIEMGSLTGDVVDIKARCTKIRTNDNIDIIVPNSQIVSQQVINWSHLDTQRRFRFPVGVHYESDVQKVRESLIAVAKNCPHVLNTPLPDAKFMSFGDSALNFELWVWTTSMHDRPDAFHSEINYMIWNQFKKDGIAIPYPQQDVYIKEMPKQS